MVTISLVRKTNEQVTLRFTQARPSLLNALRRSILRDVPVLAIDEVEFTKNSSALYDEMLAHRLGLIPLTTDYSTYEYEQVRSLDERSAKSRVTLTLTAKGPGMIRAEALHSQDPYVKPAQPSMPVIWLEEGQEVEAQAIAVMGRGKEHAKFQPGLAWYERNTKVTVSGTLPEETRKRLPEAVKENDTLAVDKIVSETLADAVESIAGDHVTVEKKADDYLFHVESFGQLPAATIIIQALRELERSLTEAQDHLSTKN